MIIVLRQACFSNPNNTFLGKKITFEGGAKKPGFDISKFKHGIDDFYEAILDYDKGDTTSFRLTKQNIRSRVKVDEVLWGADWDYPGKVFLGVYLVDSRTSLTYSFKFRSPSDPVKVEYCYD